MAQMGRPGLTLAQQKDLWRRWKEGQSLSEIGRALGRHAGSIHGVVKANGGIVPAARTRAARTLTLSERDRDGELLVSGELHPPIPGERSQQLLRELADLPGEGSDDAVGVLALDLDQQQEPRVSLDEAWQWGCCASPGSGRLPRETRVPPGLPARPAIPGLRRHRRCHRGPDPRGWRACCCASSEPGGGG